MSNKNVVLKLKKENINFDDIDLVMMTKLNISI